jgi:5'-nucleotidase
LREIECSAQNVVTLPLEAAASGVLAADLARLKSGSLLIGQCLARLDHRVEAPESAEAGGSVELVVTGAKVDGEYKAALVSDAGTVELGDVGTPDGTALVELEIPGTVAAGEYTLELAGYGSTAEAALLVTAAPAAVLDLVVTVSPRCVAGKVYLYTSVKNNGTEAAEVATVTSYGSKTVAGVTGGRSASGSFAARLALIPAGQIAVTAEGVDGGVFTGTATYNQFSCGS